MKISLAAICLLVITSPLFSQQKDAYERLALTPKAAQAFPLDYKILRPRTEIGHWDEDYDRFYSFLTPALRKTQASLESDEKGVHVIFVPNSIMPHAQLDTNTVIQDAAQLKGTWRMLTYRSVCFNDSVNVRDKKYYRLRDTILDDKSADEVFMSFDNNQFQLHVREAGESKFKKRGASRYSVENKRYLMLYKLFKAGSGVSQVGIDENGRLILNYPKVVERIKKSEYVSYYTVIEQYILEKVKG